MRLRSTRILLPTLLVAVAIGTAFAGTTTANAAWRFSGSELKGSEVTVGFGVKSTLAIPGAAVTCEHFLYRMVIFNTAGVGEGEVTELPLFTCTAAEECTVEAIEAEELPWPARQETVGGTNYVVIEEIAIGVLYSGKTCPLNGVLASVTGSAGGSFDNATEAATFSAASFAATGTALEAFGLEVQLEGVFPTEAFQWHRGEPLTMS